MVLKTISPGTTSNPARHGPDGAARLINCYVEDAAEEGKTRWPLYAADGLTDFATLANGGATRAMIVVKPDLYVVSGRLVFRLDAAGTATVIGAIPTDGPVYMARNGRPGGDQVLVASDGFYGVIEAGQFAQFQSPNFYGPRSVAVVDGYGIAAGGSGRWQTSGQYNARSWDALEFASAESNPDDIEVAFTHEREVMLFGTDSLEWWQNTGGADFVFSRVTTKQIGCASGSSVALVGESIAWVDDEGQVRLRNGYGGQIISNGAVSRAISGTTDKTTIKGFSWAQGNHAFYAIRCPSWCWVFDLYTQQWHERQSHNSPTWNISDVVKFGDKWIAGDAATGKLYEMSSTAFDDAGSPLIMTVQPPMVHSYPNPVKVNAVYLDAISGIGANSSDADDSDPQIMVQWSFDGGLNWSGERMVSLGQLGDRLRRIKMTRFGKSREDGFTFKFSVSANVLKGITGLSVDATKLKA